MGERPLPELTAASLKMVPPTILVVGGIMTAIWWVIGRRMAMQAQTHPASDQSDATPVEENDDGSSSDPSHGREIQQ